MAEDTSRAARPSKRPRVLVACQRCKSRRQKCDNHSPACSNCSRAKVACVYTDNAYPSSYVKALEERVRQLEEDLAYNNSYNGNLAPNQQPERQNESHDSQRISRTDFSPPVHYAPHTPQGYEEDRTVGGRSGGRLALGLGVLSSCAAAEPHYFGFSAGLSLAHFVQVAIESGNDSADVSLPLLADRPFANQVPNAKATIATLPTFQAGARYLRAYVSLVHPLYPFLSRSRLWKLHRSLTQHGEGRGGSADEADLTIMHLVYATGSRCLQLLGRGDVSKTTPEGHFLRAMKNMTEVLKYTSTKAIEITLLLAIHSMRSPSGSSVWHLSGLAIRQCLELGLHKQRAPNPQQAELEQYRRRLFWSTYIFERKTALVLGRPFAVSDDEIELDLPTNANDESIDGTLLSEDSNDALLRRTTLSFHRYHIQLYQIHTHIRRTLHQMRKASKGELYQTMTGLFDRLDQWQKQVLQTYTIDGQEGRERNDPYSDGSEDQDDIESSPAFRPVEVERAELLLEYHKARRSLLQPLMIEGRQQYPFDVDDYAACADASGQICQLYRKLHRLRPIPFTLRDLHAVFVAGFTLIYCVCTCPDIYSAERASDVGACSTVLYVITEQWSSAKKYRDAFEIVAEKMMDSARRYRKEATAVSAASRIDGTQVSGPHQTDEVTRQRKVVQSLSTEEQHTFSSESSSLHPEGIAAQRMAHSAVPTTSARTSYPPHDFVYTAPATSPRLGEGSSSSSGALFGIELDLDSDIYDIEGLLSTEGLDWFTGAVI